MTMLRRDPAAVNAAAPARNLFDPAADDLSPDGLAWWAAAAEAEREAALAPDSDRVFPDEPEAEPADLAPWLAARADRLRAEGTRAAAWLAARVDALAAEARSLHAPTPDVFDDRRDALDRADETDAQFTARYERRTTERLDRDRREWEDLVGSRGHRA